MSITNKINKNHNEFINQCIISGILHDLNWYEISQYVKEICDENGIKDVKLEPLNVKHRLKNICKMIPELEHLNRINCIFDYALIEKALFMIERVKENSPIYMRNYNTDPLIQKKIAVNKPKIES